jgi:hypothetical protein
MELLSVGVMLVEGLIQQAMARHIAPSYKSDDARTQRTTSFGLDADMRVCGGGAPADVGQSFPISEDNKKMTCYN